MSQQVVHLANCLEYLKTVPDGHFTAVVTDPPYGISYKGAHWDQDLPDAEVWRECLRVLRPGGTALIFSGSRTFHRLGVDVEDAGFEIRDCLSWLYGSGFPKGYNLSVAIDRAAGAERPVVGTKRVPRQCAAGGVRTDFGYRDVPVTAPATPEAQSWDGYNTTLKPAWEPILLAAKAYKGGYVDNALEHGVAGLNIDDARIGGDRWPANVAIDHHVAASMNGQSRYFYCAKPSNRDRSLGMKRTSHNWHPTVKPVELMRWLVRLVTMPSGTRVLDPFCGSGSTGVACALEGVDFVGTEWCSEYYSIARVRIAGVAADARNGVAP